jgi:putative redox protein
MAQTLAVSFSGNKRVDVQLDGFVVRTDQSLKSGGDASAPEPFDLFLAALASCAGIYALNFCQSRQIGTEGLALHLEWQSVAGPSEPAQVALRIRLPVGFPEKYRESIVRAVDQCAVKRLLLAPPQFEVCLVN